MAHAPLVSKLGEKPSSWRVSVLHDVCESSVAAGILEMKIDEEAEKGKRALKKKFDQSILMISICPS
jgi:hypothetical protein